MRMMILAALAVAACSGADTVAIQKVQLQENVSANPQTPYQHYRVAREAALTGQAGRPTVIPVALPVRAPTAADITPDPAPVLGAPRIITAQAVQPTAGGYPRAGVTSAQHLQACGRFYTDQAAQEAFIRAGGPEKDPAGLDPDGDGYACNYRPETGL